MEMKFFWADCTLGKGWEDRKALLTGALESGASGALVLDEDLVTAAKLGDIDLVVRWSKDVNLLAIPKERLIVLVGRGGEGDGTLELPAAFEESRDLEKLKELKEKGFRTCGYVEIRSKAHERLAALEAVASDHVLVVGKDWKIIPLENLIAELQGKGVNVMAGAKDAEEARLALETLELGVDGVLIQSGDINEFKKLSEFLTKAASLELKPARITAIKQVGMGDRVCVDTASILRVGEGMLVGSQASGLFLVHSETLESEYVASRPFRVNAGAVHAYVLGKDGKTKYLSEIGVGDEVLAIDTKGAARTVVVGRAKIEKRPLLLVEAECEGTKYKTLLQNAETINLVDKDGRPVSVVKLKTGDEVLIHVTAAGRHFGMRVEESVIER